VTSADFAKFQYSRTENLCRKIRFEPEHRPALGFLDLNTAEKTSSHGQFARLAFLSLIARLPAHAHIGKAVALHLLRLIKIAAVNDDGKTQLTVQARQIDG